MSVKLEQRWIKRLLQLPESGRGDQQVERRLAGERELNNGLIFKTENGELPDE